ncbi:MAG: hypothetical protein HDS71_07545 [Bacteroidales bacterium]|nr:hypothetical protein [Bacteroidales bacterium]
MTLIYLGFGLMTVAAVIAVTLNFKLIKKSRELRKELEYKTSELKGYTLCKCELRQLPFFKTYMEERTEPRPHFAVYRKGLTRKIDLLWIGYKANDPDDREYKRIFAQERVDALNEMP